MNRTRHAQVLAILERRALRYRKTNLNLLKDQTNKRLQNNTIDETGTVEVEELMDSEQEDDGMDTRVFLQEEIEAVAGVDDEILQVHGAVPTEKREGSVRLLYENMNGINNRIAENGGVNRNFRWL